ncbi:MAG: thioredoxin [Bacteroidota bacterium]
MSKFNELINSEQPVLVDFFAEWCGPCKMMAPILKEVVSKVGDKARVIKVDIDKNSSTASKYGVQSVPTLMIFKNGQIKWRQSGVVQEKQLIEAINLFL